MRLRQTLRRWHIWLGWLVGVPMLFWTVSGVVMVLKPIEEVRGTELLAEPPPVRLSAPPVPPQLTRVAFSKLILEPRAAGPRWVVQVADGPTRLADPLTGRLLPSLGAAEAAREVIARYTGQAEVASVRRTSADDPPLDLRRPVAAWAVELTDGTRFYVDAGSGEVVARRTRWWRVYDWMWGLHILDLRTREESHNPWVIGFGIAAMASTLLALLLLPLASRRRRRGRERG
ncbi:PepSY domain-containing protein [uncultured Sphingomonas sp.]|uniref:PepSY domain-containing protein n=1 Tax=uncultured Sphingomonas sp. TaxID=158754 RepID=UPI0025F44B51|nr:PepSY domain-containing protein [uncultured Sphingomonas sp.]